VQTVSGKQFPLVILPERTWTSLTFVAMSNSGHEMLRADIPVKTPPPPQIKWTSSRLEGDDYVISFSAEDVGGKDANVNCAIVSPKGLTGVLSARHGKTFTFTVKNVTSARPQAVIVRTSIHGIGGVSTPLDRTFPILY
jgi:predicted amidohydrolase